MIKLKDLLIEVADPILDEAGAQVLAQRMAKEINAPFVQVSVSTLGGKHRPSVMLKISLDPQDTWQGAIFHNSRFSNWSISHIGEIEQFTISHTVKPKFRKARFKTHDEVIKKINAWIEKAV